MKNLLLSLKNFFEHCLGFFIIRHCGTVVFFIVEKISQWFLYRMQLNAVIKNQRINLVLDVGANEGQFAQKLRYFFSGEIISFEPVKSVFDTLAKNAARDKKWQTFHLALGNENGEKTIHKADNSVFSSLLTSNVYCNTRFGNNAQGSEDETIQIQRLEFFTKTNLITTQGKRIFLKMDTQGFDMEVFKGLGEIIHDIYAIQTEASLMPIYDNAPSWTDNLKVFEQAGFTVAGMYPVNRDGDQVIEYDCLLIKK